MDTLSQTFQALADPTRRAILSRLSAGPAFVNDIAQPFLGSMSLPAVAKHLKVLEGAGLITKTVEAQWRSCHLNTKPLRQARSWIEHQQSIWENGLESLEEYLETFSEGSSNKLRERKKSK